MARLIAFLFVVFIAYEGNGQNFASRKKKSIETRNQTAAYIQSKSFEKIKSSLILYILSILHMILMKSSNYYLFQLHFND
jgi:hypothetical protein